MKANFSFLEYSYNPDLGSPAKLYQRLEELGWTLRSRHKHSGASIWNQNKSIILLRENIEIPCKFKPTGIGFMIPSLTDITLKNTEFDADTGFYKHENKLHNFNIYLVSESIMNQKVEDNYKVINDRPSSNSAGLEVTTGLIINNNDGIIQSLFEQLGFDSEEKQGNYTRLTSAVSKFTIMIDSSDNTGIRSFIIDTQDVFRSTALYSIKKVALLDVEQDNLDAFGKLAHKIKGYNVKAWGNEESYSLENVIPAVDSFPTDIIFRQRRQYLKINQYTLEYYDNLKSTQ
ncbi:MAG: hypothetical protein CMO97_06365 [Woeseia sp.]|nr:hypothetical protein [Woeseia sp.]